MKHVCLAISLTLLVAPTLVVAADEQSKSFEHYKRSEFDKAAPGFQSAIANGQDVKDNQCRLGQCWAARALKTNNIPLFNRSMRLLTISDPLYKKISKVYVSNQGFGDSIMLAAALKQINEERRAEGKEEIILHLDGPQRFLKPMLERSGVASTITTGDLKQHEGKSIIPLIAALKVKHTISPFQPYLVPKQEAVAHWQEKVAQHKGLKIATAWRSGSVPVLGGRTLDRDLPLKEVIDIALAADPNAHVFLVQGPPHHNIVTQSMFNKMNAEDKNKNRLNVIPDHYTKYITQVPLADGKEQHGSFEDTLALFALHKCIYVGSDTVVPHMSALVANNNGNKAIMILPKKDNTSCRDWRWKESPNVSHAAGETAIWYSADKFRLFEINISDHKARSPIVQLLKEWHKESMNQ